MGTKCANHTELRLTELNHTELKLTELNHTELKLINMIFLSPTLGDIVLFGTLDCVTTEYKGEAVMYESHRID